MGRKNRLLEKSTQKVWRVAAYIRLSREDGNDESLSIQNQRMILLQYLGQIGDGDSYYLVDSYVDDGVSGTDYDRAAFQRMLTDIEVGRVNCVIVKDLSRPFRNYADQGFFLENYFPRHDIRFISLGLPALDSYRHPEAMDSIAVPIQGVMNDNHCRETSLKVRQVFDMKRKQGAFIGAFAPYGYQKDPKNRNALIIDREAASVVRDIFHWYLEGISKAGIVRRLNDQGVPCPSCYKHAKGFSYYNPHATELDHPLWCSVTVTKILQNAMYIGCMVQGRYRVKSYKVHTQVLTAPEEWYVVPGTHEAVVSEAVFEKVQRLLQRDTRTAPNTDMLYLFSGFLRCADCKRAMARSKAGKQVYYYCRTYKDYSKKACTKHSIKHMLLEEAVLYTIRRLIDAAVDLPEVLAAVDMTPTHIKKEARIRDIIIEREKALSGLVCYQQKLFQAWQDGDISKEDFYRMNAAYDLQVKAIKDGIFRLKQNSEEERNTEKRNGAFSDLMEQRNIPFLTRRLLTELLECIWVWEDGRIEIHLQCADHYKE